MNTLLELIKHKEIKKGTNNIVNKYKELYDYPPSFSGKYHTHEKTIRDHVNRCVYFAQLLLTEFSINELERDIVISACILHDIGKIYCGFKIDPTTEGQKHVVYRLSADIKHHELTNWAQSKSLSEAHPILSSLIIALHPFPHSRRVQDLVEIHMSHWYKHTCRQPNSVLEYIMCSADYLATKEVL